jgi:diaminopimelate epimerase
VRHGRPIPFTKVHGLGNDFVLIDALADPTLAGLDFAPLTQAWCDRHRGIGADGVLLLCAPSTADGAPRMRIFNSDGAEAEMCGNGVRCVARVIAERHARFLTGDVLHVQVGKDAAATLEIRAHRDAAGGFVAAEVDMGEPRTVARDIPVDEHAVVSNSPTTVALALPNRRLLHAACVSMGNPHAVIFVDRVEDAAPHDVGPLVERHHAFPQRTNVQFVEVASPAHIRVRTWERGAGPTLACGTGACAAVVAGVQAGKLERSVTVSLPGGDLRVRWDEASNHVWMTGPAEVVFNGAV